MPARTTTASVTFRGPFRLAGFDRAEPPGTYEVETDEELIDLNGRTAYRRIATMLYLRQGGTTRAIPIEPAELQAALERDAAE
jgi:hypothetical protein